MRVLEDLCEGAREVAEVVALVGGAGCAGGEGEACVEGSAWEGLEVEVFAVGVWRGGGEEQGGYGGWEGKEGGEFHDECGGNRWRW